MEISFFVEEVVVNYLLCKDFQRKNYLFMMMVKLLEFMRLDLSNLQLLLKEGLCL